MTTKNEVKWTHQLKAQGKNFWRFWGQIFETGKSGEKPVFRRKKIKEVLIEFRCLGGQIVKNIWKRKVEIDKGFKMLSNLR